MQLMNGTTTNHNAHVVYGSIGEPKEVGPESHSVNSHICA